MGLWILSVTILNFYELSLVFLFRNKFSLIMQRSGEFVLSFLYVLYSMSLLRKYLIFPPTPSFFCAVFHYFSLIMCFIIQKNIDFKRPSIWYILLAAPIGVPNLTPTWWWGEELRFLIWAQVMLYIDELMI